MKPDRCVITGLVLVTLACAQQADEDHAAGYERETHWSYSGADGPEHWAELDADYALCGSGMEQSPIDLRDATIVERASLERQYRASAVSIARNEHAVDLLDNGHTIQITYDAGSTLEVDGIIFELAQFRFPCPERAHRRWPVLSYGDALRAPL